MMNGTLNSHTDKTAAEPELSGDSGGWDAAPPKLDGAGSWDQPMEIDNTNMESSWENITVTDINSAPTAELAKPSSKPDGTRSWASIFNKPAPVPAPTPPKAPHAPPTHEALVEDSIVSPPALTDINVNGLPLPLPMESSVEVPKTPPPPEASEESPAEITPSKDELTETNLEQVLDISGPAATATVASTMASTIDPRAPVGGSMSHHISQQPQTTRPPMGGYATSAYKAAGLPGRSASYQRKILDQQEAVVMPGKHAVDRTAVQFGSMGLSGSTEDMDVDSDREEAETRAQPPQHSPIAPRAALPPAPQQQPFPPQIPASEPLATPRQAPGLPPVNQQNAAQQPGQPAPAEQTTQQNSQTNHSYNQFNNRYGTQTGQPEASAPAQKAYEPFGQQMQQQQHQYDNYPASSQAQAQAQAQAPTLQQAQSHIAGYSSAANENSLYYTSDSQRNAYQNYYGSYGQHSQQNPQDAGASQQRIGSAFGTSVGEQPSQNITSQAQHPQARYGQAGEAQTSGNSTPNPSVPNQQPQPQQTHHMIQQQGQGQAGGQQSAYPYGHPYYASPYYSAYMNQVSNHPYGRERPMFDDVRRYDDQYLTHNPQFGYGGNHGGYGGGPFGGTAGKQGMYGQPHQGYGMSPQTSYDHHSSSPANVGAFGHQQSAPSRDGATGGSLASYGRSGSAQATENQQQYSSSGAGAYGNMPDVFSRSSSGFPGQAQGLGHQQMNQSGATDDSVRGYGDPSKVPGGPSPALGQPGDRPGSAANNVQGQSGLPPPNQGQSGQSQQAYGGYPSHVNHQMHGQQGSQYGAGPGALGAHHQSGAQNHQGSGYGAYGAGFGGSYYGGANNRGGWGGNYGGH